MMWSQQAFDTCYHLDMAAVPEPEIIPPQVSDSSSGQGSARGLGIFNPETMLTDEHLDMLATILDDWIQIPGTNIRFGLEAIVGIFPIVGDIIASAFALIILFAAWQRGVPRITQLRMLFNIAVDTVGDMIPFVGDTFWVFWKANRRNYELLVQSTRGPQGAQAKKDWLFFAVIAVSALAIITVPLFLVYFVGAWLIHLVRG